MLLRKERKRHLKIAGFLVKVGEENQETIWEEIGKFGNIVKADVESSLGTNNQKKVKQWRSIKKSSLGQS